MGNEQSNNSHLHNDKEVDAFNKYMQQQIISQTAKQSNTKNTQLETTKNIQIYDKKTKKNISRQHKEIELEKEKLRKREEVLLKQEQLLNKYLASLPLQSICYINVNRTSISEH